MLQLLAREQAARIVGHAAGQPLHAPRAAGAGECGEISTLGALHRRSSGGSGSGSLTSKRGAADVAALQRPLVQHRAARDVDDDRAAPAGIGRRQMNLLPFTPAANPNYLPAEDIASAKKKAR